MLVKYNQSSLLGSVEIPSSKSISNRLLMIHALSSNETDIIELSTSNDTVILKKLLDDLQVSTDKNIVFDVQDAGTPFRFLTAFASIQKGKVIRLTGTERMKKRPIGDLVDALRQLGAQIEFEQEVGFPPLIITGKKLRSTEVKISGHLSSQFISALCLIAPCIEQGLQIFITDELVSAPYVELTLDLMKLHSIEVITEYQGSHIKHISIPHQKYSKHSMIVEGDWSGACFFYAMAIMSDKVDLQLNKMKHNNVQGDEVMMHFANYFGVVTELNKTGIHLQKIAKSVALNMVHFSLHHHPDLAIPLIVACALKYPTCTFDGLHHLALKESNRLMALATELKKIDIELIYENDMLNIINNKKTQQIKSVAFESYNDHRIVMALSLVAMAGIDVSFNDVQCIQKSFPTYFQELEKVGFEIFN